jgi:hypothetical protein
LLYWFHASDVYFYKLYARGRKMNRIGYLFENTLISDDGLDLEQEIPCKIFLQFVKNFYSLTEGMTISMN